MTTLPAASRTLSIFIPLLLLLGVGALLLGAKAGYAGPQPATPSDWTIFPVVTATLDQTGPSVGDGVIVWADDRNHPLNDVDLYGYDLATQQEFPLVVAPLSQDEPSTSGDWVVYRQGTNISFQYTLNAIRLSTHEVITIAGGAANPTNPDMSGPWVVWQDFRNYNTTGYDVYGYNLNTMQEVTVTTAISNQFTPRISGNTVVWQDLRMPDPQGVRGDIYGFDLSTRQEFTVCTALGNQLDPDIGGNIVAWEDLRNDPNYPSIYGYNLQTHQEFPVAVAPNVTHHHPRVAGDWIVWDDDRNGTFNHDVFGYNWRTGQEVPIITEGSFQGSADISTTVNGPLVVWQDYRNGQDFDLYAAYAPPEPTPTVTRTPVGGTTTPTPAATATVCPIQFSDVPSNQPFYPYIRCLACRGILNGYTASPPCAPGAAPCFQPGANVTRGQVAKIVANAAGFSDAIPSGQQTFTDVPPSNPFWIFIERAVLHGVISGYSTSPPCPGGVPCFLPANDVTRGQMAKIDTLAMGYADPIPSTQQTFADVPYGSPFWVYVERAALHGVISGYSTSPPCPGGTPCFLPANGVTRGQTAKIVANTFYPSCQTPVRR